MKDLQTQAIESWRDETGDLEAVILDFRDNSFYCLPRDRKLALQLGVPLPSYGQLSIYADLRRTR